MPTIEIVSIGTNYIPDLPRFDTFACMVEAELQSHRSLFQEDFDSVSGVIVHLGNKEFQEDFDKGEVGVWFAGQLIDWSDGKTIIIPTVDPDFDEPQWWGEDQSYGFRFLSNVFCEVCELLSLLLEHSPVKQVFFSTDYQFGPSKAMKRMSCTLRSFIDEHDANGLRWNCLYQIVREEKAA